MPKSAEHRKKIGEANRGKVFTVERKRKIGARSKEALGREDVKKRLQEGCRRREETKKRRFVNHRVVSVRLLQKREDCYDLTVEKYHNFALSAGVFVHNCGMIAARTDLREISTEALKVIMGRARKIGRASCRERV